MGSTVLQGEITGEGVFSLLAEIEERRTSGVLRFESAELSGDVHMVAGQFAVDQPELADGRDVVEVLLELREGTYELVQKLPSLPVSHGTQSAREGSLDVHVPADLMNYCEAAGLTGLLHLERDGRTAEAIYDRGELTDIRVDGTADEDLHDVFGWTDGQFKITAHSIPPTLAVDELPLIDGEAIEFEAVPRPRQADQEDEEDEEYEDDPLEGEPTSQFHRRRAADTSEIFLRSVEVALTDIIEEREKHRGAEPRAQIESIVPPARPSSPAAVEKVVRIQGKRKRKRQSTVRIVYSSNRNPEDDLGTTRHVAKGERQDGALPQAAPERITDDEEGKKKKKKKRKVRNKKGAEEMAVVGASEPAAEGSGEPQGADGSRSPSDPLATVGWVAAVFALFFFAILILARLPPLG
ncbi:MAG: DUF4388 domain-containing protein [Deltaproteobacteria bacterium]|nr:DUF4388 domain-containing protein [Deltaproteobacteria bacterium]